MADVSGSRGAEEAGRKAGSAFAGRRFRGPLGFGARAASQAILGLPAALARSFTREIEDGRGFHWLPVLVGLGAVIYFSLPDEPSALALAALSIALVGASIALRRSVLVTAMAGLAAVSCGLTLMKLRTDWLAAQTLPAADVLTVSGWVESRDPTGATGARLVIRIAAMEGFAADALPYRVRVTAQAGADWINVGDGVTMLASLRPPQGAIIPGGHSFGQVDFYDRIGASGFTYGAPRPAELGEAPLLLRLMQPIERLRKTIGDRVVSALPGEPGQIARALITGERGGISDETDEALRESGLAHVISISGLHMALVYGVVFGAVRALLALSPALALRRPIKKWSVAAALLLVGLYFALSGASVPTQRAFIMIAVMSGAVLFDQRAFSIRNIAIAALIVIAITPEAVLTASFQMSFAATLALIAGYETLAERRRRRPDLGERRQRPAILTWIAATVLTSFIAGLATVPFAAFHFQRTAPLSLLANILAAPAISLLIMPFALAAVLLMPLGLEGWPLTVMGFGIEIMTRIAALVAGWSGGGGTVRMAPPSALFLAAAGLLWICLWRERWRLLGLAPLVAALLLAIAAPRPDILVNAAGTAVAVRGPDGTYRILGGRGATYDVETWLRADADRRPAGDPSLKDRVFCDALGCTTELGEGGRRVSLSLDPRGLEEDCRLASIVVTSVVPTSDCANAVLIDGDRLATFGAHAIFLGDDDLNAPDAARIETAYPPVRRAFMPAD